MQQTTHECVKYPSLPGVVILTRMDPRSAPASAADGRFSSGAPDSDAPPVDTPRPGRFRWASGGLIILTVFLFKLKTLLLLLSTKFKPLIANPFEGFGVTQLAMAAGSMLVSLAAYAWKMGFAFGLGFLLVLVIHEIGHALMIRAKGLRAGAMVFIPFVGGAVTLRRQPRSAYVDAQIGLAGPIAGTIASWISLKVFELSGDPLYLAIAVAGFVLNLFNLTPIGPLDGGRIAAAITKWMWVLGAGIILWLTLAFSNPFLLILLVLSVVQIWLAIGEERRRRFYDVTIAQRAGIGAVYFVLVGFLSYQSMVGYATLQALRDF